MRCDHITIVAADCRPLRDFFVDIAGLREGPRPAFSVHGYWLYLEQQAVLHLIQRAPPPTGTGSTGLASAAAPVPAPARIDHLALRLDSAAEWQQLLQRLHRHQVPYQLSVIHALQEQQLFVSAAPGITVEFVIAARLLSQDGASLKDI